MVLPLAFLIGMIFGIYKATRKKGSTKDKLHYGAVYGITCLLLALIVALFFDRLGVF